MTYSPVIVIHLTTALAALLTGAIVLASRKGTQPHRLLGRVWVGFMLAVAVSSFWIKTSGAYSWIHLLSVGMLLALVMALVSIYRGKVNAHRRWMRGAYVSLAVAGLFTLLPHRRLGTLVFQTAGLM